MWSLGQYVFCDMSKGASSKSLQHTPTWDEHAYSYNTRHTETKWINDMLHASLLSQYLHVLPVLKASLISDLCEINIYIQVRTSYFPYIHQSEFDGPEKFSSSLWNHPMQTTTPGYFTINKKHELNNFFLRNVCVIGVSLRIAECLLAQTENR